MLHSHYEQLPLQLIHRRQPACDRRLTINILADIEGMAALVGHQLRVDTEVAHQRRMRPPHQLKIRPGKIRLGKLRFDVAVLAVVFR